MQIQSLFMQFVTNTMPLAHGRSNDEASERNRQHQGTQVDCGNGIRIKDTYSILCAGFSYAMPPSNAFFYSVRERCPERLLSRCSRPGMKSTRCANSPHRCLPGSLFMIQCATSGATENFWK